MESEFWAAIVGAVVGSIGGGWITWLLQRNQDRRQTRERNQALARSLIFKLVRIHSDLEGFRRHVEESISNSKRDGLSPGWQSLRPIGNLPPKLSFTAEEMGYLLSLKDFGLFNDVAPLDVLHSSTIGLFELYAQRRLALTELLHGQMEGAIGTSNLTAEQSAFLAPKAAELDLLVGDIKARVEMDSRDSRTALEQVNRVIKPTLGYSLQLKFEEQDRDEARQSRSAGAKTAPVPAQQKT